MPAVRQKTSHGKITDGDKGQDVCRRLDQCRRVETEVSERNPLDILPMWDAIKLPPGQADDEQHRSEPEKQHESPGGIDHAVESIFLRKTDEARLAKSLHFDYNPVPIRCFYVPPSLHFLLVQVCMPFLLQFIMA
jgi:hypothetical protein